jgi:glycerol-3-phosphate acyltransferase PlsY
MSRIITCLIAAYVLGSIPFGYLIVRTTSGGDVRETGSGGTGATNVTRRAGKLAGVLTLMLDALKGAAAIAIARLILGLPIFASPNHDIPLQSSAQFWVAVAGIAVIIGHCFPVWLKFRGGKGVATGVGVFLMLAPLAVAGVAVVFVTIVSLTRYISLGSIVAAASLPVLILVLHLFFGPIHGFQAALATAVIGAALIIFMHRANIQRLLNGTESKFK